MQQPHMFETVDAMAVRTQFGTVLDKVIHTGKRYLILRRGKAKALLVPITDAEYITEGVDQTGDNLDAVYAAFEVVRGVIKDPRLVDASSTIDEWAYGVPPRPTDAMGEREQ